MTTTSPGTAKPILSMRGISKRFGAVQAMADIDFDVSPGEVVALVGDNGAGKSTLVKAIAGVYLPDEGTIEFDGKQVTIDSPAKAQELGIATVFQDLALCDNLDVVANLYLGREVVNGRVIDEVEMEKTSWQLLRQLSAKIPSVRIAIASLSGGQRQTVAIARSLLGIYYVYGGTTPAGFDCSGFTQYVYAHAGISIPRTATAQMNAATIVSNPQPGDLVFTVSGGIATHVGIYTGPGMMIDSPRTGKATSERAIFSGNVYGRF